MEYVKLRTSTLGVLVAGLYCSIHEVESIAIPESIWIYIAEQLEYFLPNWNYEVISFEDWVEHNLTILPKAMLDEEDIKYLQENTLYNEIMNGNVVLIVSMDIRGINAKQR